jgi:hypothetical protein
MIGAGFRCTVSVDPCGQVAAIPDALNYSTRDHTSLTDDRYGSEAPFPRCPMHILDFELAQAIARAVN